MDPITVIVAALALGASDGVRDTAKHAIGDAYSAVKNLVTKRYASVSADVEGLEQEPEEGLRRALLEKKLTQAGAGDDVELYGLAQALLSAVEEQAPDLPATIGVVIRRAIGRLMASGDLAKIYNKWFLEKLPSGEVMGVPMSPLLKAAIQLQALPE